MQGFEDPARSDPIGHVLLTLALLGLVVWITAVIVNLYLKPLPRETPAPLLPLPRRAARQDSPCTPVSGSPEG